MWYHRGLQGKNTCFIIMVADGREERFPLAPAAKSKEASPQALPTQSVKIGGLTYLDIGKTMQVVTDETITNIYLKNDCIELKV